MLLATTSSSRAKATWRESPMRTAFSIGRAPFAAARAPPSRGGAVVRGHPLSQACGCRGLHLQAPCQSGKFRKNKEFIAGRDLAHAAEAAATDNPPRQKI